MVYQQKKGIMHSQKDHFDILIIGSGPAGSTIARKLAGKNKSIAVIDHEIGGTCALKGCIPKKVLANAAKIVHESNNLFEKRIITGKAKLNWQPLIQYKKTFTENVTADKIRHFTDLGITVFEEKARFIDENKIKLENGPELTGEKIVISTGAKPVDLPIDGKNYLENYDAVLENEKIPKEVVFIGGGFISFEFAHILARNGRKVTIFNDINRPLPHFDPDIIKILVKASAKEGIDVYNNHKVTKIEKEKSKYFVHAELPDGQKKQVLCDIAIHGAGRIPDIENLNLEKAGVEYDKDGILVNMFLQSATNEKVYIAGDVADTPYPFTFVAEYEANVVVKNILKGRTEKVNYDGVPQILFTTPEAAGVGFSEEYLQEKNYDYAIKEGNNSSWDLPRTYNEMFAYYKIFIDKKTDRILGAHLLGAHASEVINVFALAIQHNLTRLDLMKSFLGFPTFIYDIKKMLAK